MTDPAIPQLKRLTRPTEAVRLLNSVLEFAACGFGIAEGPLAVHDVAVLRGHPGSRWTLRYAVESRVGAASTIFAKVKTFPNASHFRKIGSEKNRGPSNVLWLQP